jgi:hypothetical protein
MTAFGTSLSNSAVRLIIPPPAKGSMRIFGLTILYFIHLLKLGTNQVYPPGYRKGLL